MHTRKPLILVLIFAGLIILTVSFQAATTGSSANLAVSFVGFTNGADGTPMTIVNITNRGPSTVVIWGYYAIDAKQKYAVECATICLEHYVFLAPKQSQAALICTPETKGLWKVSIGYDNDDLQCRWVLFASKLPAHIRDAIPQKYREPSGDLVASDWISSNNNPVNPP